MKKTIAFILLLALLMVCTSCHYGAYYYVDSEDKSAFIIASYNIPGASDGYDTQVELIEEDSYGRKLYRFSCICQNGLFYKDGYNYDVEPSVNLRAYVISQKETKKGVYYLDSVCYMIRLTWDEFSDELIEELKALNQWDTELNTGTMCYRPYPGSKLGGTEVNPLFSEVEMAYKKHTGKDLYRDNVAILYVCNDTAGKCLAFVREYTGANEKESNCAYAIIALPSTSDEEEPKYYIAELDDFYQQNDVVIALKEEAGWLSPISD